MVYTPTQLRSTIPNIKNRDKKFNSTLSRNARKSLCLCGFLAIAKNGALLYHIGMNDEMIKANVAKNISWYRKEKGMTQAELAEILNYSDKSVSKWERGDGLPDICVLAAMAELFGVTINDLIGSEEPKMPEPVNKTPQRLLILLMSMGLVWLVAMVGFFAVELIIPGMSKAWLIMMWAIPVSCIVSIVFSELWWPLIPRFISASALVWSLSCCAFLTFTLQNMYMIFIVAGVVQVLVILWFIYLHNRRVRTV